MTKEKHPDPPCARAVHADPNTRSVEIEPLPETVRTPAEQKSPAKWAYEWLILHIKKFEQQLDGDHEIAMGFTGGSAGVLRIEGIG